MNSIKIINGQVKEYTIVLTNREKKNIGQLSGVQDIRFTGRLNGYNELSFSVYKYSLLKEEEYINSIDMNKYLDNLWNNIIDFKLVWVKEIDEYFEIQVKVDDSDNTVKHITAKSLCESELSQIKIYGLEINTDEDIDRDDYKPTTFCNIDDKKHSLLHRVFNFAPHYTIKYVSPSLANIQRTFSADDVYIYDFLTGEISEQFNCLFKFDSSTREVYVYDLYTICNDCGERGDYMDECPKCGSRNIEIFGEDTSIYIDKTNLTDLINLEVDVDNIKNCFKLEAGDEVITAAIRDLNPNGSDKIYTIPSYIRDDMSEELIQKLDSYNELYESKIDGYEKLSTEIYDLIDDIVYHESTMMPTIELIETTAETEASKLTSSVLSPVALTDVTSSTSVATANSAIKNYASVYIKTGYVKLEVVDGSTFEYKGKDSDGWNYGIWTGKFKVTSYSDKEDTVTTDTITVKVNNNYKEFVRQKIQKNIANANEDDEYVIDVLDPDVTLNRFETEIQKYSLSRVTSFHDAIRGALDVLIELDQATESADLYESLYHPYYDKIVLCEERMDELQSQIDNLQKQLDFKNEEKRKIQAELNLQKYLGDLYPAFCSYIREDKYVNSNYISDGLDNSQIIAKTKEFLEVATEELNKASQKKYKISANLYNLLVIDEFKSLLNSFELGNFIRMRVDRELYKLRLLEYTIDFSNLENISVEFSNASKLGGFMSDIKDIISSAQSMSKNYDTVVKQAENGNEAKENVNTWLNDSLDNALVRIKNNTNEEITISRHGLLGRSKDDITGAYSDEQFLLTHNLMAYTDTNWRSCKLAMGKHNFTYYNESTDSFDKATDYGLSAQFVLAGYLIGNQIIGGDIYSDNYSSTNHIGTHIDLREGTFSFGDSLTFDGETITLKNVLLDWQTTTKPEIGHVIGLRDELNEISTNITITAGEIRSEINDTKNELSSSISQTAGQIRLEVNDVKNELSSSITQTANAIRSEVSDTKNELYSSIEQTAGAIRAEIASVEEGLSSSLEITAGEIRSEINDTKNELSSSITQAAGEIRLEVNENLTNLDERLSASINLNTEKIQSEVNRATLAEGDLSSRITQTAENITLEVNRATIAEGELSSRISANANAISLKVQQGDVVSEINQSADLISINSNRIEINSTNFTLTKDGNVTASSITITGGSISVGNGNFYVDTAGNVTAKSITITGGSVAGSTVGSGIKGGNINNYSIDWTKFNDGVADEIDDIITRKVTADYINSKFSSSITLKAPSIYGKTLTLYKEAGLYNSSISLSGSNGYITCTRLTCTTLSVASRVCTWVKTTINGTSYFVLAAPAT